MLKMGVILGCLNENLNKKKANTDVQQEFKCTNYN